MEDILDIIGLLDNKDKQKLSAFAHILIRRKKYDNLRKEIDVRRTEIKNGDVLSHEELWANI